VVKPTSVLDVDRVLAELGRTAASLSTRKRTLRRARGGGYRDQIAAACFAHARTAGDVGSSKLTGQLRGGESGAGPLGAGAVEAYPAA